MAKDTWKTRASKALRDDNFSEMLAIAKDIAASDEATSEQKSSARSAINAIKVVSEGTFTETQRIHARNRFAALQMRL